MSPARIIVAALILLAAGLGIGAYLLWGGDDDTSGNDAALDTTSSTPDTTTTTLVTTTTSASSSTTSASTTSTVKGATTTVAGGSTTTTTRGGTCGSGTARVVFAAKDLATTPTESAFTPEATIDNQINKPIEVEEVVADVGFPDGSTFTVRFSTAGVVIAPGTSHSFTAERLVKPAQYTSATISRFAYFTEGLKARCRVST